MSGDARCERFIAIRRPGSDDFHAQVSNFPTNCLSRSANLPDLHRKPVCKIRRNRGNQTVRIYLFRFEFHGRGFYVPGHRPSHKLDGALMGFFKRNLKPLRFVPTTTLELTALQPNPEFPGLSELNLPRADICLHPGSV